MTSINGGYELTMHLDCHGVNYQCTQIQVASSWVSLLQTIICIVWNGRLFKSKSGIK